MNLPNLISISRILMTPLFAALYLADNTEGAVGVLLLCAASDVLDGAVARRFGLVTELGKALDPVADKLMQGTMMLCAAVRFPVLRLLLAVHIVRELSLGLVGLRVLRVTGRVYGAEWYGKLCSAAIYALMLAALALKAPPPGLINAAALTCVLLSALCFALYMRRYIQILRSPGEKAPGEQNHSGG